MGNYLVTFKPQGPYFFGNEKSFAFPGANSDKVGSDYYAKSELIPTQSTVVGVFRYIFLPVKKGFGEYTAEDLATNAKAVGERSFQYGACSNKFGVIKSISPVFIMQGEEKLIPTPMDHTEGDVDTYTPFSDYAPCGDEDGRIYPTAYNAKNGVAHSYVRVSDKRIFKTSDIFATTTRVGINRANKKEGFFKKDHVIMKNGFSFGVYLELDDAVVPQNTVAFMGQGKSTFTVKFTEVGANAWSDLANSIGAMLQTGVVYCMSDAFITSDIYGKAKFAVTELRDYRAYGVNGEGKVTKSSTLYKLIKAGSVFVSDTAEGAEVIQDFIKDDSVADAGYNCTVKRA